jgi:ribonuclease G
MSEEILINVTAQETRVAVIEQGVVQEIHIERNSARGMVGNIYRGKVVRVLPGMQSAFVDIAGTRAAFLHVADMWGSRQQGESGPPIERLLSAGEMLMVQVVKDPLGTKGARLTTQISLAGRFLVYLPNDKMHIGISQRIEVPSERELLKEKFQQLLPPETTGGYILRTMAETASVAELAQDVAYLHKLWAGICARSLGAPALALLYQDLHLGLRVLRDFVGENTTRIWVDAEEVYAPMQEFARDYTPDNMERLTHYLGQRALFDLYGVEEEIEKALARRVDLKSGGYLIIDQTEALTTVDVNTGAFVGIRNFDETIFKTNLEAAQVIARQLRLRNLGGIIIVDFIDMDNELHQNAVLTELRKALARDRTRMSVNGFTQLGLVEMTRKRTRESLAHVLCEPCEACEGRGELKTAHTVCYQILRELTREAQQFDAREFRVLASQKVIDLLLDEESQSLALVSDLMGKPVSLQVESLYSQEAFDIVLI